MSGRLIHNIGSWDKVTVLRSVQVTWAHRLRAQGCAVACDRTGCAAPAHRLI